MVNQTNEVIPNLMKAAVVEKHKSLLTIKKVPVPSVGPKQVLVKVVMSGVCHTDVHVADGDWDVPMPTPIIPGHEACGYVVKVGELEQNIKVGDRVGIPWLHEACGSCQDCNDGWETVCSKQKQTGFTVNGGFAEYTVAHGDYVCPIPKSVSFEQAAPVMCAGVTAYKALKTSNVRPGQTVVILGATGGLGSLACQYAKAMGMKVIAVSRKMTEEKKKMLKNYGVDHFVSMAEDLIDGLLDKPIRKLTRNREGAHGVLCLAPSNQDITDAIGYVRVRGTIVVVGAPSGNYKIKTVLAVAKAIKICGSPIGNRNDLAEAMQFVVEGRVNSQINVMHFDEINGVIDKLRNGEIQGRVILSML